MYGAVLCCLTITVIVLILLPLFINNNSNVNDMIIMILCCCIVCCVAPGPMGGIISSYLWLQVGFIPQAAMSSKRMHGFSLETLVY